MMTTNAEPGYRELPAAHDRSFGRGRPVHDGGQALPLALVALAVGTILAAVFIAAVVVYLRLSSVAASDLLDYYTADAGIEQALAPLVYDPLSYPSPAQFSLALNNRTAAVEIGLLASQTITDPGTSITATVATYLITSQAPGMTIRARAEARKLYGQPTGTVRVVAWNIGR